MVAPIDYTSAFANVPSPVQAFTQGLQSGADVQKVQLQQQQQQLLLQRQQQMQADMKALSQDPTSAGIAKMSVKYPELSEQFKRSFDMLAPDEQQTKLAEAIPTHAAILSGDYALAAKRLTDQADALQNSGNQAAADQHRAIAKLIIDHPETAKLTTGMLLSSAMGPDKYAAAFGAQGTEQRADQQSSADLLKKSADASKASSEAAVAAGTVPALIEKPTQENLTAESQRKIAAMNVAIAQANSETERGKLTLERDKYIAEQAKNKQTQGSDAQNQMDTIGQSLATAKSLMDDPLLQSSIGVGSLTGKILGTIPGTDNKDFRARVETLKSQQFLTAAKEMKGMGALSDAEGARIERAVASLDTDQSVGAFKNALGVIQTLLEKGQAKLIASGKLPKTGGAFVLTHPKFGNITEGDINRMMTANPGSIREQVMQYLGSQ